MRSLRRSMRRAWLGKMLPLGLGAIAGTAANRKLADGVISNVQSGLGAAPAAFATPLPERDDERIDAPFDDVDDAARGDVGTGGGQGTGISLLDGNDDRRSSRIALCRGRQAPGGGGGEERQRLHASTIEGRRARPLNIPHNVRDNRTHKSVNAGKCAE